jgi:5-methylcytosine-specific restriction endonuclease McrA
MPMNDGILTRSGPDRRVVGHIPTEKQCTECRSVKSHEEYYRQRRSNGGTYLYSRCKSCWNHPKVKEWRRKNCEHRKQYQAKYRAGNGRYYKAWYEANKWRYRIYRSRRRQRGMPDNGYPEELVRQLLNDQDKRCAYCNQILDSTFEIDHIVPLSRGGTSDRSNLCAACRPCNRQKHARTPEEWRGAK